MKNSDSLKNKLEAIRSFVTLTTEDLKVLEENLKKIEGFSLGTKEVAEKFKEYVSNNQIEIKKLLNEQKMTQPEWHEGKRPTSSWASIQHCPISAFFMNRTIT